MLFIPKGALPGKMTGAGYARGWSKAGHWMRARAAVVNPNTDAMSRWRHLFNVAKMNWRATQATGSNTAPINGITPAEAWFYLEATYIGILLPGLYEGDEQLTQTLIGTSSVEAFEVMISTMLAQLDMPTPTSPAMTTAKATAATGPWSATAGNATLSVGGTGNPQVGPITAIYSANLTLTGITVPAVPTPPSPAWTTSQAVQNQFAMLPNSIAQGNYITPGGEWNNANNGYYTTAVTGLPTGVTALLNGIPITDRLWIAYPPNFTFGVSATPDAAPGTYQGTFTASGPGGTFTYNFVVVILDPTLYTLALSFTGLPAGATAAIQGYAPYALQAPIPETLDGLPNGTNTTFALWYDATTNTVNGQLSFGVTVDPSAAAGSYTFGVALSGFATAPSITASLTVTTIAQTVGQPCPPFQICQSLSAKTVYDADWNVIGFGLSATWPTEFNDPSQPTGYSYAFAWAITASPAYTSGYSVPAASTWLSIYNGGPNLPTAAQLLTAWQEAFGALPTSGKIKIELQWVDPLTGAPGPQVTKTISWETGTNRGAAEPAVGWPLPTFNFSAAELGVLAPGITTMQITLANGNNYTGTITWDVAAAAYLNTGTPPGSDAIPAGLTATFDPPTMTFTDGVPDNDSTTLTLTAASGAQQFQGNINISESDSEVTANSYIELTISGDVVAQPPYNYLSMTPTQTEIYTPVSSITALLFDLFNTGPNEYPVSMLTTNTDADYTIEFGQGGQANATATATSITFELATGANVNSLVGETLSSAGYAPAGYNVTDAPIIANDGSTVTVLSDNNPAAMTTAGIAAVINNSVTVPAASSGLAGTASCVAFIEVAAAFTGPTPSIQIVASCGDNTTYSIVRTTPNPGNGFQMAPLSTQVNQPVPGTSTLTLTLSNTNPAAVTATLSPFYEGNGVTLSLSETSVTIPAASDGVPGTATVTLTITATEAADLTQSPATVQGIAGSYSQIIAITFTDTQYGPLYPTLSPTYITPTKPASASVTLTMNNASAQAASVEFTIPAQVAGVSVTLSSSSLSVPAGTTSAPGTASITVTVTVSSAYVDGSGGAQVNYTASGFTAEGANIGIYPTN